MWDFISDRWQTVAYDAYQHASLVIQCVLLATVIAVVLAALIARRPLLEPLAGALSAIGLTIPTFALIGLMIPISQLGAGTAVVVVTFYAVLPILRNAVVGLAGIRVATQMAMGVAAIAAYVLGPGLGKYTFAALASDGGANSMNQALIGVFGVVIIALVVDALLLLLGRVTISKGIRTA